MPKVEMRGWFVIFLELDIFSAQFTMSFSFLFPTSDSGKSQDES